MPFKSQVTIPDKFTNACLAFRETHVLLGKFSYDYSILALKKDIEFKCAHFCILRLETFMAVSAACENPELHENSEQNRLGELKIAIRQGIWA